MTLETYELNKEKVKIKILLITNNYDANGNMVPINKNFTLDENGDLIKYSNAIVYDALFKEYEFNCLKEFDSFLKKLQPYQCIALGKSAHEITEGSIVTKGKEDLYNNKISRSNEYTAVRDIQCTLFDVDPDEQMTQKLLGINTPELLNEAFIEIFGDEFVKVSRRIGFGSSYGVSKQDTNEPLTSSFSMHAYLTFINATAKKIDLLIEYIKRKAVEKGLWYFKIHKDGSCAFRTIFDLSVLKSINSRLVFEAPATIGDGLIQHIPESTFINCENGIVPLDINTISLKGLQDWRPVFEKEKLKRAKDIAVIKEKFRKDTIYNLVQRCGYDEKFAEWIINEFIEKKVLSASFQIYANDGVSCPISAYLKSDTPHFEVYDFLDPQKGLGKSRIYINKIFDAKLFTYLRGGTNYKISFSTHEILEILNTISFYRSDIDKILYTLLDYIVEKEMNDNDVQEIIRVVLIKKPSFEFTKNYYNKYIEHKCVQKMDSYAFLKFEGKSGYVDTSKEKLNVSTRGDMIEEYRNKFFYSTDPFALDKNIKIKVFEKWSESATRKEYNNIAFTDKEVDNKTLNLFQGFPYEPIDHDDISLDLFFELVLEVICDGDKFMSNVVLAFIAQIIQDPFNKLGTCLIIAGKKRIGKGSFVKTILELLGRPLSMQTSKKDDVFTRFNQHLQYTLLVYLNEAFWHGDKSLEGQLKSLTSDEDMFYEIKGGAQFASDNYTRLILDSNEKFVVPATLDDGRYIALLASECKKGDSKFMANVNNLRNSQKAMEKLMYFFSHFNYSDYEVHLREAPKTKFLGEQIRENFNHIQQWWLSCLTNGTIPHVSFSNDGNNIRIANKDLWKSFRDSTDKIKIKYMSEDKFYSEIKEAFLDDIIIKNNQKMHGTNIYAKVLAELNICRKKFVEKYHLEPIEGSESDIWLQDKSVPPVIGAHYKL